MNRRKKKREQFAEQAEMDRRSKAKYGKLVGSWQKAPGQSGWSKVEDDFNLPPQIGETPGLDRAYEKQYQSVLENQRIMRETVCPENTIIHTFKHKDSVRGDNYICSNNQYPCFDKKSSCLPAKNSSVQGSMLGRVEQVKKYQQRREVVIKAAAKARETAAKAMGRISKKVDKTVKSVVKLNEVAKQTEEKLKAGSEYTPAIFDFSWRSGDNPGGPEVQHSEVMQRQAQKEADRALAEFNAKMKEITKAVDEINGLYREAAHHRQEGQLIDTNFDTKLFNTQPRSDPFDAYNMR